MFGETEAAQKLRARDDLGYQRRWFGLHDFQECDSEN
jgi:hypothetical protein